MQKENQRDQHMKIIRNWHVVETCKTRGFTALLSGYFIMFDLGVESLWASRGVYFTQHVVDK